jgi:hypothetical protein
MNKKEWLVAILFMGTGLMCMFLSAVSFQSHSLFQFGRYVKTFLGCSAVIVIIGFLLVRWKRLRK